MKFEQNFEHLSSAELVFRSFFFMNGKWNGHFRFLDFFTFQRGITDVAAFCSTKSEHTWAEISS